MRIKHIVPALIFGFAATICSTCSKNAPKIVQKHTIENDLQFQRLLKDTFSRTFTDEQKIISFPLSRL